MHSDIIVGRLSLLERISSKIWLIGVFLYYLGEYESVLCFAVVSAPRHPFGTICTTALSSVSLSANAIGAPERCSASSSSIIGDVWKVRYEELKKYKSVHGDCLVPSTMRSPLSVWASQQRKNKQNIQPDRLRALDELGFVWNMSEYRWDSNYKQLIEYCNATKTTATKSGGRNSVELPMSKSLRRWVARQRKYYEQNMLAPDRVDRLNQLDGFLWDSPLGSNRERRWNERYQQLCDYRDQHDGDTNVPARYRRDPQLGLWVQNQRIQYEHYLQRQQHINNNENDTTSLPHTSMSADRIDKLNRIDFKWKRPGSPQVKWSTRYKQLLAFRDQHGHCRVPMHQHPLGPWVFTQRMHYRFLQEGRNDAINLTKERVQLLEDVDFCWNNNEYRWNNMLELLKNYHEQHDTFDVPPEDKSNASLRHWVLSLRKNYNKIVEVIDHREEIQQHNYTFPSTLLTPELIHQFNYNTTDNFRLTPERIDKLNGIGFVWSGIRNRSTTPKGPNVNDWNQLFDKMKEQGITSKAPAKQHIFDGEKRFLTNSVWDERMDEDALVDLWNAEDEND